MGPLALVPVAQLAIAGALSLLSVGTVVGGVYLTKSIIEANDKINKQQQQKKRILSLNIKLNYAEDIPLKKACEVFELADDVAQNIKNLKMGTLKSKYRMLIEEFRLQQDLRKCINTAFELLTRKHFGIEYSQSQMRLVSAIVRQDFEQLNQILIKSPSLINFRQKGTNYPLIYLAVRTGSYQLVQFILNKNVSLTFENDLSTPMHCAAFYGHYQIIGLLVRHGLPVNIKNTHGHLPIEDAKSQKIKQLLKNASKDNIHSLITKLQKEEFFLTKLTIKYNKNEVVHKIILKDYNNQFHNYDDSFHGTPFQNLFSIAKHGLRKAGDKAGNKIIQVPRGHCKNMVWAANIFSSPSIFYSGCPAYSPQIQFLNTKNNKSQLWLPIVQLKIQKNSYGTYQSTSRGCHTSRQGQPTQIQFITPYNTDEERKERVIVVALMFVKKQFLSQINDYHKVTNIILRSEEETNWRTHWMKYKK